MALFFDSLRTELVVAAITTIVCVYLFYRRRFNYWKGKGVPYIQPSFPFGNIGQRIFMTRSSTDAFQDCYRSLEGHAFGGIYLAFYPALVIRDPNLIRQVLVKDFAHFQDRGIHVDEKTNPLGAHLFNMGGSRWQKLRTKISPAFTSGKIKMMFEIMHECAKDLTNLLEIPAGNGDEIELKEVLSKYTTDVIGTCAFGLQIKAMSDPDSEFHAMGRKVFIPSALKTLQVMIGFVMPSLAALIKLRNPNKSVSDFFMRVVKETLEYRQKNGVKRNDFMQLMIHLKNKGKLEHDGDPVINGYALHSGNSPSRSAEDFELTENLLAAQAFVFLVAGFETSSAAMSFALHELAVNQDIQSRLREEVKAVLEDHGGTFSYDAIMKMDYLDKVFCETLRKYPPLAALPRECNIPYHVPGTRLRLDRGTRIFVPVYSIHHDPKYFPDPDRFDPERFSEEEKSKRPNYTYIPFGEGPRICIGMRFAQLQAKLGLAMLLHRYEFSVSPGTSTPLRFDTRTFFTIPVGGIWLRISPA